MLGKGQLGSCNTARSQRVSVSSGKAVSPLEISPITKMINQSLIRRTICCASTDGSVVRRLRVAEPAAGYSSAS